MATLPRHFGSDASLEPGAVDALSAWLTANAAGSGRRAEPPTQNRITRSGWFLRKHREVPNEAWDRASVRSPSNCTACHAQASEGVFDEHDVHIPR